MQNHTNEDASCFYVRARRRQLLDTSISIEQASAKVTSCCRGEPASGCTRSSDRPSRADAQSDAPTNAPSSETIRTLLAEYTGPHRESLGYVAGIADAGGHRVISVGASGAADNRALDGDSVFEIGSITKVFTALLMADMAQRGEVAFDDPVAKYLPPEGRPQPYKDRAITLIDLATHSSLPRLPPNLEPKDPANPYAGPQSTRKFWSVSETSRAPAARAAASALRSSSLPRTGGRSIPGCRSYSCGTRRARTLGRAA